MDTALELVCDAKASLGEGPAWDHKRGKLVWVNILEGLVYEYDPMTGESSSFHTGQLVGAAVPATDGGYVLALHHGFYRYSPGNNQPDLICDPEGPDTLNRFNDGKCDPAGRFWAGTMGMHGEQGTGALYRLDPGGIVTKMIDGITCSNGVAWSPDTRTMYYTDTPTRQVVAYDYDMESGDISNRRVAVQVAPEDGMPDGMAIDEEGMLWVAHWGGSQVIRYHPEDGSVLERIAVPASQTTSCAFGGPNLDELYITSARVGLSEQQLIETPNAGGVFRIKTKVRGTKLSYFQG